MVTCGCGLAAPFTVRHIVMRSEAAREESAKELDRQYGYDMHLKNVKQFSESDQHKVKCELKSREQHLKELKDPSKTFDVLVIGGGCNGAGVVLDAATRGLYCAVIDRGDFASESSSRSTKLIHGGVRYLQEVFKLEKGFVEKLGLVVEGLDERNFMLNSAAYMNRKLEMVIPCGNIFYLGYYLAGVCVYHFLSYFKWCFSDYTYRLPPPSVLSKASMKKYFPELKGDNYGVRFSEGQMNDARLCVQTMLTSSIDGYLPGMKGAVLGNYVEFLDFVKDASGKCVGAKLRDRMDGKEFTVKAKAIVNCAGVFSDSIRLKDNPKATPRIVTSRGVHLILPHKYTEHEVGILIPKTADGRIMFVLPFQGLTIAGTTDHKCDISSGPIAPPEDIKEITTELGHYFNGDLDHEYTAAWCGIRPLVAAKEKPQTKMGKFIDGFKMRINKILGRKASQMATKSLTRTHEVEVSSSGLVSLLGGKWTSYRGMGEDAVNWVLKVHPEIAPLHKFSISRQVRLMGAYTTKTLNKSEKTVDEFIDPYTRYLHEQYKLEWDTCAHLVKYYGTQAIRVAKLGADTNNNQKIHAGLPVIKAQIIYAIRKELGVHTKDVIFRRLGVGFTNQKLAEEAIPAVADVMARELGWNDQRKAEEIEEARKAIKSLC